MTTREARGLAAKENEEDAIAAYLQHNPDFFERHQALLLRLRVPHARGGSTISLVERQIEVLREKHAGLEDKLAELVSVARANDAIAEKLHRFTRKLLRARSRAEAVALIEASLREDFDAFHGVLVLIGEYPDLAPQRFVRSIGRDDAGLKSFDTLFASGKPRCGQVRDTQREFLFGQDANDIGSVALVPLLPHGDTAGAASPSAPLGVLALGSTDRDRFHPGMSTEFLARMADLITDSLATGPGA
ncbi:MAG TPA: DUF484 family protein [Steroidobacteraceae bacterium]|nr:DUF484 family protein [Steroidobacteraceae bacterium]